MVDALADQLAQLSLMMKHKQTAPDTSQVSTCSFCRTAGHHVTSCPSNPHRSTRFTECGKLGYAVETCWKTPTSDSFSKVQCAKPDDKNSDSRQVTCIDESGGGEVAVVATRNDTHKALAKQHKGMEGVPIPRLLTHKAGIVDDYAFSPGRPMVPTAKGNKKGKKIKNSSKSILKEHGRKYDAIS